MRKLFWQMSATVDSFMEGNNIRERKCSPGWE